MEQHTRPAPAPDREHRGGPARRSLLGTAVAGAALAALPGGLAACTSREAGAQQDDGPLTEAEFAAIMPTHQPLTLAEPDIPGVDGSTPGYTTLPAALVKAVDGVPGKGGTYTVMSPAWWTTPPGAEDNAYFQAVNEALGATLDFQIADGNTYADKLQAVLASPKDVPDWVVIPTWNIPPRFQQGVSALFTDLTDFIAGDEVLKYPNLANLPTDAWKYCTFNGRIYGLPYPGELIGNALFYRRDIFGQLGLAAPTSADELLQVAKDATDPAARRWGCEDIWDGAQLLFGCTDWMMQDGNLISRFESPRYREAIEFMRELFASGAVHPDAVAGNTQQAKDRFEAGQTVISADGLGGWHEALTRVLPSNPSFDQQPMDWFAPDGGAPTLYKGAPVNIFSFLKKTDDAAAVEEMLAIANYIASPFGSEEFQLVNYGVEGVTFERDAAGAPALNERGSTEVTSTYGFLVSPPIVNAKVQFPQYVRDFCDWMARQAPHVVEPVFYGQQIQDPSQFSSLGKPFDDLAKDIIRGRSDVSELDAAVKNWRSSGGDELRAYREKFLTGDEAAS
ncbi:extracellular solute-binding protein [Kineococcus indalonis]|uniref:extracellular solute-binding protein n=1 Tax=Kineococcus indalonis TaxID=2696566 RepID=UPI001412AE37|nr:extracellular solute-binding protein [Kineococcus indalonis]NAZ84664.1 extracellular solute-binding protein [Kineococcus indalonis]